MDTPLPAGSIIVLLSAAGILLPLGLNLLFIVLSSACAGRQQAPGTGQTAAALTVSVIIVVRNGEDIIGRKMENTLSLRYPSDRYEIIIYSDGSTDGTERAATPYLSERVRFVASPFHKGKISGMNAAVRQASGDILVFSDADALLEPDAVLRLLQHFSDPEIGGVCGRRVIGERSHALGKAQGSFIAFDSAVKVIESRRGSISSNDGKLYAIRRELYREIPEGVTDDLYVCLSVVGQQYRFIFEPEARASIPVPSRSAAHEVVRRRRIVSTSLRGIWLMRRLLNPFSYGLFAFQLAVNKVLRRLLPVFLLILFPGSGWLARDHSFFAVLFGLQGFFYLSGLLYWFLLRHLPEIPLLTKVCSTAFYFCLGNYGTLRGVADFLLGRQPVRWTPLKRDKS